MKRKFKKTWKKDLTGPTLLEMSDCYQACWNPIRILINTKRLARSGFFSNITQAVLSAPRI